MHVKFPHKFSRQEAVLRVKNALNAARPQLGDKAQIDEERWENNILYFAFTANGQHITGHVEVTDKEFDITAKLPLMLRLFEGRLEKMIREQGAQMLG